MRGDTHYASLFGRYCPGRHLLQRSLRCESAAVGNRTGVKAAPQNLPCVALRSALPTAPRPGMGVSDLSKDGVIGFRLFT